MQPAVIEWNELTSQSKIYFSDLLLIIFRTQPVFSGVYGKIDHVLNGADHRAFKKRPGSGNRRHRGSGIGATGDWGIVTTWDRGSGQHGMGGSWRITEESVLNSPSALSIRTTIAQLFQTSSVAV
jgi:hypothetical protein